MQVNYLRTKEVIHPDLSTSTLPQKCGSLHFTEHKNARMINGTDPGLCVMIDFISESDFDLIP